MWHAYYWHKFPHVPGHAAESKSDLTIYGICRASSFLKVSDNISSGMISLMDRTSSLPITLKKNCMSKD